MTDGRRERRPRPDPAVVRGRGTGFATRKKALPPRWVIVVRGDRHDLYENLHESFELDRRVRVILDRRRSDRRAEAHTVKRQRRRVQRRKVPELHEMRFWENAGFCVVYERAANAEWRPSSTVRLRRKPPGDAQAL